MSLVKFQQLVADDEKLLPPPGGSKPSEDQTVVESRIRPMNLKESADE
jgi:hypothetical protein